MISFVVQGLTTKDVGRKMRVRMCQQVSPTPVAKVPDGRGTAGSSLDGEWNG